MGDSESQTALVSGFYGPGAFACWICQYISLVVAPKRGPRGKLTLDLIAFFAYPIAAVVDAFVKLAWLYAATREEVDVIDMKAIQLAIAFKAPVSICIHALTILCFTQPWPQLRDDKLFNIWCPSVPTYRICLSILSNHTLAFDSWPMVWFFTIAFWFTTFLLQTAFQKIFRNIFPLYLPGNTSSVFALMVFLSSPIVAIIITNFLAFSPLVSRVTWAALVFADDDVPGYMLPAFNNSITELDQAFPLVIGIVTVAWSTVALFQDRGFLQRRTQDSVSASEANPPPRTTTPPETTPPPSSSPVSPPRAALRRRQTNQAES